MSESAISNSAAQKASHKCCAAALCTNKSDNRKDPTHLQSDTKEERRNRQSLGCMFRLNKGDLLETSKVKIENERQNEDLAEVVADLKRQLLRTFQVLFRRI